MSAESVMGFLAGLIVAFLIKWAIEFIVWLLDGLQPERISQPVFMGCDLAEPGGGHTAKASLVKCPDCVGMGGFIGDGALDVTGPCKRCNGTGRLLHLEDEMQARDQVAADSHAGDGEART